MAAGQTTSRPAPRKQRFFYFLRAHGENSRVGILVHRKRRCQCINQVAALRFQVISPRIQVIPPGFEVSLPNSQVVPPGLQVNPPGLQVVPPGLQVNPPGLQVVPPGLQVNPPGLQVIPPGLQVIPPGFQMNPPGPVYTWICKFPKFSVFRSAGGGGA
jgi:hypothetical protein